MPKFSTIAPQILNHKTNRHHPKQLRPIALRAYLLQRLKETFLWLEEYRRRQMGRTSLITFSVLLNKHLLHWRCFTALGFRLQTTQALMTYRPLQIERSRERMQVLEYSATIWPQESRPSNNRSIWWHIIRPTHQWNTPLHKLFLPRCMETLLARARSPLHTTCRLRMWQVATVGASGPIFDWTLMFPLQIRHRISSWVMEVISGQWRAQHAL